MKLVGGSGNTNNIKLSLNKKMLFSSTWGTLQCVSWLLLDSPLDPKAKAPWLWNLGLLLFPGLVCPFQFLLFLTVSQCHWGLAWTSALFPVTWISLGSCEPSPVSYSGTRPLSSCFPFPILWILSPHTTSQFSWSQESWLCITQAIKMARKWSMLQVPKVGCWGDLSDFISWISSFPDEECCVS